MPGSELRVDVAETGGSSVIALRGELDLMTAPVLRAQLNDALAAKPKEIVLDIVDLAFIDSSGLSLLVEVHNRLAPHGGRLRLRSPNPVTREVLRVTQTDTLFTIDEVS